MSIGDNALNSELFIESLRGKAEKLSQCLNKNDLDQASELIQEITRNRDDYIFHSVGKLTRALHNAINTFNVDADKHQQSISSSSALAAEPAETSTNSEKSSDIQDASDRLSYVIELTEQAADRTMDKVEAAMPIAQSMSASASSLQGDWERFGRREMPLDEFKDFYHRLNSHFSDVGSNTQVLSQYFQEIILEQGYQDLTGQLLKRVIGLVSDVESELVSLVRLAAQVEEVTGLVSQVEGLQAPQKQWEALQPEGPQINAESREDVVTSQSEVDDLLSSLGF